MFPFIPPALKQKPEEAFKFPTPISARMLVHEASELKDLIREDAEKP
jgi:hypothetical protein